jgi:hypothetical protein
MIVRRALFVHAAAYSAYAGITSAELPALASGLRPIIRHPSNHAHMRPTRICIVITSACESDGKGDCNSSVNIPDRKRKHC